jgi:hypothetical protein
MATQENTLLVDCQERHAADPERFEVPSPERLAEIWIGYTVKVIAGGERFWLVVTKVYPALVDLNSTGSLRDKFAGTVANDLVNTNIHGLKRGDLVEFERRHVAGVEKLV